MSIKIACGISTLNETGHLTRSDIEAAHTFIILFETVYNSPVERRTYSQTLPIITESLNNIHIRQQLIIQELELLDVTKTPGPDNAHLIFLKKFLIIFPSIMFSKNNQVGFLPAD